MEKLTQALKNAGLNDKEADVYLTLLKMKEGTAYKIAKNSNVKKPTTYVLLEELRSKGLVLKTPSKTGTIYKPNSPDEFIKSTEDKLEEALRVLPQLKSLFKDKKDDINVYFFEGIKDSLFYEIEDLKNSEINGFYAKYSDNYKQLQPIYMEWVEKIKELNISIKGITPANKKTEDNNKLHPDVLSGIEFVDPEKYSSSVSIETTDKFIRIIDIKNLNSVIIKNNEVAKTMNQIFALVSLNFK